MCRKSNAKSNHVQNISVSLSLLAFSELFLGNFVIRKGVDMDNNEGLLVVR